MRQAALSEPDYEVRALKAFRPTPGTAIGAQNLDRLAPHAVGNDIHVKPGFLFTGMNIRDERDKFRAEVAAAIVSEQTKQSEGTVIFPGQPSDGWERLIFPRDRIAGASIPMGGVRIFTGLVFVCVDYSFMFQPGRHQTAAVFTTQHLQIPAYDCIIPVKLSRLSVGDYAD